MFKRLAVRSAVLALATVVLQAAHAGGFNVYQPNPAATIVPKTAWLNPAGMTAIDAMSVQASLVAFSPTVEFDADVAQAGGEDGDNAGEGGGLPDVSFVMPFADKWRFGVSLTGLYGGNLDYDEDFVGRYALTKIELAGLGLTPSVAYKVSDRFSVGVGAALISTTLDEDIAINNDGTVANDGEASFDELDDTGVQPFVGVTYRFTENLLFGGVYRAQMDLELEGDLEIDNPLGFSGKTDAQIDWTNPQTVELGLQIKMNERSVLLVNADWEDWSEFSDTGLALTDLGDAQATFDRQWDDTYHAALIYARYFGKNIMLLGVSHDTSAVEDEHRTFDIPVDDTSRLTGGYFWMGHPTRKWGVTGSLIALGDGKIDQTTQDVQVAGEFDTNAVFAVAGTFMWTKGQ